MPMSLSQRLSVLHQDLLGEPFFRLDPFILAPTIHSDASENPPIISDFSDFIADLCDLSHTIATDRTRSDLSILCWTSSDILVRRYLIFLSSFRSFPLRKHACYRNFLFSLQFAIATFLTPIYISYLPSSIKYPPLLGDSLDRSLRISPCKVCFYSICGS